MNLLLAILFVECGNDPASTNPMQISKAYVKDCNTILDGPVYKYSDRSNRAISISMVSTYLTHYGAKYSTRTGEPVTQEVLARIHNGGPMGYKNPNTVAYWEKVKLILDSHGAAR